MTPNDFCYWLQGFAEIESNAPDERQWLVIKDHLKLVFEKKTPDRQFPSTLPTTGVPHYPGLGGVVTC